MRMFACAEFDVNNVCTSWVEFSFLGLPPLSESEANTLMAEVIGLWALAFILAILVRTVAQKKL